MLKFIFNFFIFASTVFLTARHALACASCGFNDDSSNYFLILIVFLTTVPLICVGGVVYYLKKQHEKNANTNGVANTLTPKVLPPTGGSP